MDNRRLYLLSGSIGTVVGGLVPSWWGAGEFSLWAVILGVIGGIAAILLTYYLINR